MSGSTLQIDETTTLDPQLLGDSPAVVALRALIRRVAATDSTVLIQGESGTGKELVARLLHAWSPRAFRPFVAVNCGAIPGELMESELFGHERGAFTGAQSARKGRFELAGRGTLFLDEIAEMSPALQVKILRVLQERCFERVGGSETIQAPARIVAATHRDLEQQIQLGRFREDLFYRLHVVPIQIPPLRTRGDDILLLAEQTLRRLDASGLGVIRLGDGVERALLDYHWPGNVRELQNLMERLVIMHAGATVHVRDLPAKMRAETNPGIPAADSPSDADDGLQDLMRSVAEPSDPLLPQQGLDLRAYLERIERSLIEQALAASGHVIAHAAGKLGLRRTTLVEKIRKYGLRADT
ncbi:sigma-54 dependent transcriptional regulator [Thiomonas sp.]|jgi:sigma-54 specific flagellar transcriptional regulator A|uniref:sigma-54 interaction domain-containing protein n=1 Tax=Thiomonas sp. TaxID=2047785 RepID=UPI00258E3055|nr:sigma-54 dependent transcriptional regulator [Thiomonas sp.]